MALPPEIIDNIIDFLHDDTHALKACSLVCTSWLPSSRYHLFRHVTIGDLDDPVPRAAAAFKQTFLYNGLYQTILASPIIASFVKHLVVYRRPPGFIADPLSLPRLLRKLTSLRSLGILYTDTLSHEVLSAIGSLTSLRECRINHVAVPCPAEVLQMLHPLTNLKHLDLMGLKFLSTIDRSWPTQPPIERDEIKVLAIGNSDLATLFLQPQSFIDVSKVTHLSLQMFPETWIALAHLLLFASSMKYLEVDLWTDPLPDSFLDLAHATALTAVVIRSAALLGRTNTLSWLYATLSSFAPINSLEELSLTVTVDLPPRNLPIFVYSDALDRWKSLDTLLTQSKFSRLNRVRIDFLLDNPLDDQIVPAIVEDMISQLTALEQKGILYVDSCELR